MEDYGLENLQKICANSVGSPIVGCFRLVQEKTLLGKSVFYKLIFSEVGYLEMSEKNQPKRLLRRYTRRENFRFLQFHKPAKSGTFNSRLVIEKSDFWERWVLFCDVRLLLTRLQSKSLLSGAGILFLDANVFHECCGNFLGNSSIRREQGTHRAQHTEWRRKWMHRVDYYESIKCCYQFYNWPFYGSDAIGYRHYRLFRRNHVRLDFCSTKIPFPFGSVADLLKMFRDPGGQHGDPLSQIVSRRLLIVREVAAEQRNLSFFRLLSTWKFRTDFDVCWRMWICSDVESLSFQSARSIPRPSRMLNQSGARPKTSIAAFLPSRFVPRVNGSCFVSDRGIKREIGFSELRPCPVYIGQDTQSKNEIWLAYIRVRVDVEGAQPAQGRCIPTPQKSPCIVE